MKRKEVQESKSRRKALFLLFFFLCSTALIVLGCFCLSESRYFVVLSMGLGVLVCGLFILATYLLIYDKKTLLKGLLGLYILLIFSLIACFILQKTGFFRLVDSPEKLQEYLQRTGVWMPIFYIFLQFLQVVILPIPSIVSTIAGVAIFGAFWAMIYSLAGILLGSIFAFFIGRKLGNKAVSWMVGEESLVKWQKKLKGKDKFVLTMMFVLPLFPDDILCFVAGLSTMSTKYFLIVVLFARFVGIFATCYSIDFIPFTTWWGIMLWGIFVVGIIIGFALINKNTDKIQDFFGKIRKKRSNNK